MGGWWSTAPTPASTGRTRNDGWTTARSWRTRHPAPFGMRHHPLGEFLTAFIGAGLEIEHVAEMGDRPVPTVLAIRARMSTHRSDL